MLVATNIETDRPFHESFDNGRGALNHTWGSPDTSVPGQVTLTGHVGMMQFPGGNSAGQGYGTYTFNAKINGSEPGPAILLWPGDDRWPGQEIDIVEVLHDGRHYGVVHWDGGGWDSYESVMFNGVRGGAFHEYQVVWEPGRITFKVDGVTYGAVTENVPADYDAGGMNNVISLMNRNPNTSVTVLDVDYKPLGNITADLPAAAPAAVAVQDAGHRDEGQDTLTLRISGDSYRGNAVYTISIDGQQIGDIRTAWASHRAGEVDVVTLTGDYGGTGRRVTVDFLNDAWDGTRDTDRNLHVDGIEFNGSSVAGQSTLWSSGPQDFFFA